MSRRSQAKLRRRAGATMPPIVYPTYRFQTSPTPLTLWVCAACGRAFWAIEVKRKAPGPSCSNDACAHYGNGHRVRRGTPTETTEALRVIAAHDARLRSTSATPS